MRLLITLCSVCDKTGMDVLGTSIPFQKYALCYSAQIHFVQVSMLPVVNVTVVNVSRVCYLDISASQKEKVRRNYWSTNERQGVHSFAKFLIKCFMKSSYERLLIINVSLFLFSPPPTLFFCFCFFPLATACKVLSRYWSEQAKPLLMPTYDRKITQAIDCGMLTSH